MPLGWGTQYSMIFGRQMSEANHIRLIVGQLSRIRHLLLGQGTAKPLCTMMTEWKVLAPTLCTQGQLC